MEFTDQQLYREFAEALEKNVTRGGNMLIVTLPGLGVSYFVKRFRQDQPEEVGYITKPGEKTAKYTVIDFSGLEGKESMKEVDKYVENAEVEEKFAIVVEDPAWLETEAYKKSVTAGHVYSRFYLRVRNQEETKITAREINAKLSKSQCQKIYQLTGGMVKLVKYFSLNPEKIDDGDVDWVKQTQVTELVESTISRAKKCSRQTLETLGIMNNGKLVGEIVERMWNKVAETEINIRVEPDLTGWENGIKLKEKLSVVEKEIIMEAMAADGMIAREKISQIKWGAEDYQKFSDQAVGKTMQRLNKKLNHYTFEVITGLGYKLKAR